MVAECKTYSNMYLRIHSLRKMSSLDKVIKKFFIVRQTISCLRLQLAAVYEHEHIILAVVRQISGIYCNAFYNLRNVINILVHHT